MRPVLDAGALIAGDDPPRDAEVAVASVSHAALLAGVRADGDPVEQAVRPARLDRLRRRFGPGVPFDDDASAAYGLLSAVVRAAGRQPRGRALDLTIAATAYTPGAGVPTRNAFDLTGLHALVPVLAPDRGPGR